MPTYCKALSDTSISQISKQQGEDGEERWRDRELLAGLDCDWRQWSQVHPSTKCRQSSQSGYWRQASTHRPSEQCRPVWLPSPIPHLCSPTTLQWLLLPPTVPWISIFNLASPGCPYGRDGGPWSMKYLGPHSLVTPVVSPCSTEEAERPGRWSSRYLHAARQGLS